MQRTGRLNMLLPMSRQCTVCGMTRVSHSLGDAQCPTKSTIFNNYKVARAEDCLPNASLEWASESDEIYSATAVGRAHPSGFKTVLFGWKTQSEAPSFAWNGQLSLGHSYLLQLQLAYGHWVYRGDRVWIVPTPTAQGSVIRATHTDPLRCTGCGNFDNYAAPNQTDGTFKCYSCRQRG